MRSLITLPTHNTMPGMIRTLLLFLTVATQTISATAQTGLAVPARFHEAAKVAEDVRAQMGAPGLSLAVVIDDEIVWSAGFGMADVENNVPARTNTVYRIASISKPFGATAVLQLFEQGKVRLDDPITKFVP